MIRAAFFLTAIALALASVDLAHKAASEASYFHSRGIVYVLVVLVFAVGWAAAIVATRSLSIAAGGGVLAGGALGNLTSLALWPGVPNPIVLEPIAFNLADIFVLSGFVLTACATLVFAVRNRERLGQPVQLR